MLKVGDKVVSSFGFDYDVVDIGLNGSPDEVPEATKHTALVRCPSVLQTEQHQNIVEQSEGGDERHRELVGLFHHDLMVAGVRVKEAEGFEP